MADTPEVEVWDCTFCGFLRVSARERVCPMCGEPPEPEKKPSYFVSPNRVQRDDPATDDDLEFDPAYEEKKRPPVDLEALRAQARRRSLRALVIVGIAALGFVGYRIWDNLDRLGIEGTATLQVVAHRWDRVVTVERYSAETGWSTSRTAMSGGDGFLGERTWADPELPHLHAGTATPEGHEREKSRAERLIVTLRDDSGDEHSCIVDEAEWDALTPASMWTAPQSLRYGFVDCDELEPLP